MCVLTLILKQHSNTKAQQNGAIVSCGSTWDSGTCGSQLLEPMLCVLSCVDKQPLNNETFVGRPDLSQTGDARAYCAHAAMTLDHTSSSSAAAALFISLDRLIWRLRAARCLSSAWFRRLCCRSAYPTEVGAVAGCLCPPAGAVWLAGGCMLSQGLRTTLAQLQRENQLQAHIDT